MVCFVMNYRYKYIPKDKWRTKRMRLKRLKLNEQRIASAINKSLMYSLAFSLMYAAVITFDFICCLEIEAHIFDKHDLSDTFMVQHQQDGRGGKCWHPGMEFGVCLLIFFPPFADAICVAACYICKLQPRQIKVDNLIFMFTSSLKWLKSAKFGCCTLFWGVFSETLMKWETWQQRWRVLISQSFVSSLIYETFVEFEQQSLCSLDKRAH